MNIKQVLECFIEYLFQVFKCFLLICSANSGVERLADQTSTLYLLNDISPPEINELETRSRLTGPGFQYLEIINMT